MTKLARDDSGKLHEFPDDATSDEMQDALISGGYMKDMAPEAYKGTGESIVNPILAGRARMVQGLENFPHNLARSIEEHMDPNYQYRQAAKSHPDMIKNFPWLADQSPNPISRNLPVNNADAGAQYGSENFNMPQKFLASAANYGPYALIPGPKGAEIGDAGAAGIAPFIGRMLQAGRQQIPGGATFGFTQSENPVQGAAQEAGTAAIGGSLFHGGLEGGYNIIPAIGNAIRNGAHATGQFIKSFQPMEHLNGMINDLGGDISSEANGMRFAKLARNTYNNNVQNYQERINPLLERHGNDYILPRGSMTYNARPELFSTDVNEKLNDLLEHRNLESGWEVQKQLGSEIRALKKLNNREPLNQVMGERLRLYNDMYGRIKEGIEEHIRRKNPDDADAWSNASRYYREKVGTFHSDPALREIATGAIKNPKPSQIKSIFEYPEESTRKAALMLGQEGRNRIILSHVHDAVRNPAQLAEALRSAQQSEGMGRYISESLREQMPELERRVGRRNYLGGGESLTSAATGAAIGSMVGMPIKGAIVGSALSKGIPKLAKSLASIRVKEVSP